MKKILVECVRQLMDSYPFETDSTLQIFVKQIFNESSSG
jgi:hypothetical protein